MDNSNKNNHLQMIQDIITRMAQNSFFIKECAVGVMVAIYALVKDESSKVVIISIIPTIVFWALDAYYLMLERMYRCLYDAVRVKDEKDIDYDMSFRAIKVNMNDVKKYCYFRVLFSKTIWPIYVACIATTLIIYLVNF